MFVLVYVDDIIVASSSPDATKALLMDLEKEFEGSRRSSLFPWRRSEERGGWLNIVATEVCH